MMSPADERRRLLMAAQRREPYAWVGHENVRSSLYPAASPKRRGWAFVAVSAGLVVAALGACWAIAGSGSITQWTQGAPASTTETTAAKSDPMVAIGAQPAAVPTTVQPAVVPPTPVTPAAQPATAAVQPAPITAQVSPLPAVEAAPKLAPVPVSALPAAPATAAGPHHEPAGQTTIRVVETPETDDSN